MALILGGLLPLAVLIGIGALIYFLVRGSRGAEPVTSRTLLRAYLRLAYLISLVVFLAGAALTSTAGFASAFGHDFSYSRIQLQYPSCGPVPPPGASSLQQQSYQACLKSQPPGLGGNDNRQADNLILGLSLLLGGLVIGAGHRLGQLALETRDERSDSSLARAEGMIGTAGFGLVSIVTIPLASYQLLRFAILGTQSSPDSGPPSPPGGAVATAIVFALAWGYYLAGFVRRVRRPSGAAPGGPEETSVSPGGGHNEQW